MDHPLRRAKRKLDDETAFAVLHRCTWGFLSLVGPDGDPYGVPINHVLLDEGGRKRLLFHCAREGRKIDCLKHRPRASFVAVENPETLPDKFSTAYASALVSGPVEIVDDPDEKRALLAAIVRGLAPAFQERGRKHIEHSLKNCLVLTLEIEHVCGKGRKKEEPYALAHLGFAES
ncbi:pyridoxamine 5'-phosphate oxidase family protein [Desulfovibrio aminophilus]|uniref:pyridoxamine 5'-phosphate oxidase family protein n=1 Tax=Desulfovibrio aminophilus TaxID=81425 RepID=UPI0033976FF7